MNHDHPTLVSTRHPVGGSDQPNVQGLERIASLVTGGVLLGHGLRSSGLGGWLQVLLGGLALARGTTGRCPAKRALTPTPLESELAEENRWSSAKTLSRSITIDKPRTELYRFWRDFSNLSRFMTFIERVEVLASDRAHWVARLPMGKTLEWTTRLTEDRPDELLAWMSEPDAPIRNLGWVSFRDAPQGKGTEIKAVIAYEPPAGKLGYALAQTLDLLPTMKAAQDLRRLKQLMETGEIATNSTRPTTVRRPVEPSPTVFHHGSTGVH